MNILLLFICIQSYAKVDFNKASTVKELTKKSISFEKEKWIEQVILSVKHEIDKAAREGKFCTEHIIEDKQTIEDLKKAGYKFDTQNICWD